MQTFRFFVSDLLIRVGKKIDEKNTVAWNRKIRDCWRKRKKRSKGRRGEGIGKKKTKKKVEKRANTNQGKICKQPAARRRCRRFDATLHSYLQFVARRHR